MADSHPPDPIIGISANLTRLQFLPCEQVPRQLQPPALQPCVAEARGLEPRLAAAVHVVVPGEVAAGGLVMALKAGRHTPDQQEGAGGDGRAPRVRRAI